MFDHGGRCADASVKPAVTVRVADGRDFGAVVALGDSHGVKREDACAAELADNFPQLLDAPDRMVLCAVDERADEVVGVLVASEDETDAVAPTSALTISYLVVRPSHRRRGAGRALLAAAVREAEDRGMDQVVAAVGNNDRDANRYLARLGFTALVVRRVSSTAALRRTLGMTELDDRAQLRRRLVTRSVRNARVLRRGA